MLASDDPGGMKRILGRYVCPLSVVGELNTISLIRIMVTGGTTVSSGQLSVFTVSICGISFLSRVEVDVLQRRLFLDRVEDVL